MSSGDNEKSVIHTSMAAQASHASDRQLPPPQSAQPGNSSNMATASLPAPQPYYSGSTNHAPPQSTAYVVYPTTDQVPSDRAIHYSGHGEKSLLEAYLLAASPFGVLGAHHFYLHRYYWGILYFFTGALLGFGYLIDLFRLPCLVKQANDKINNPSKDEKTISDAYTLWFPFGLLGFHHYYLGNYAWGMVYTCTAGLFGIGWIVDIFRMPSLVRSSNERRLTNFESKSSCFAVGLAASPFGIIGAHHYYLNRPTWGLVYTFTGGLGGIGWVVDWFRIPVLIKRANKVILGSLDSNLKTVDDAYVLWFPFGLLGFHHFYLRRPLWGFLYFFTLGILGIGWLVDMCRIPYLVKETNAKIAAEQEQSRLASVPTSHTNTPVYLSCTPPTQGYPGYMGNPTVITVTNPPAYYPAQQPFNYQQAGYGYPSSAQEHHDNAAFATHPYDHAGYNWNTGVPQGQQPDLAPPPYQPAEPVCATHEAGDLPEKTENIEGTPVP